MQISTETPRTEVLHDALAVLRSVGVVGLGMAGLGIGFGVLAVSYGFPWWFAPAVSLLVYAGSVEFLLIGLFAAGAPLVSVALTTLMVNSRHLFYGLTFPLGRFSNPLAKGYSVFALTDEAYALLTPARTADMRPARMLTTQIFFHLSWTGGTLAGSIIGQALVADIKGLDFLLTALFLVLTIEAYRAGPDAAVLGIAILSAGAAHLVSGGFMLPVAMLMLVVLLPLLHHSRTRGRSHRG